MIPAAVAVWVTASSLNFFLPGSRRPSDRPFSGMKLIRTATLIAALLLSLLAWWLRGEPGLGPDNVLVAFEVVAVMLLLRAFPSSADVDSNQGHPGMRTDAAEITG